MKTRRLAGTVTGVLALALFGGIPGFAVADARAATFNVTRTDDPGPIWCYPGDCTLREAVIAANANPGPDLIVVPAGDYDLTLLGAYEDAAATGDLDITDDVEIQGGYVAALIRANGIDRAFDILGSPSVTLSGLYITGGNVNYGGGIYNAGTLTLINSYVDRSTAVGGWGGGGIYNAGTLTLTNSRVFRSTAVGGNGGGIYNAGTLTINGSEVSENSADQNGGGIYGDAGSTLTITIGGVNHNTAHDGAGIYTSGGSATITEAIVIGNITTGGGGGGIYNTAGSDLTITNSTVNGNSAFGGGGGLYNKDGSALGLINCTVSGNSAAAFGGAVYNGPSSFLTLANTLIQSNCDGPGSYFTSGGNLESPGNTCGLIALTDQVEVADPKLGPLANNGGINPTIALLAESPAIDKGLAGSCPATDGRGVSRPRGAACDVGAYEHRWWEDSSDAGYGWRYLDWLGFFQPTGDPWIYHQSLDWMYTTASTPGDLWIYYPKMAAWLWTSSTTFPFLYRASGPSPAWLYYLEWTTGPVWFHNQTTDVWESY